VQSVEVKVDAALIEQLRAGYAQPRRYGLLRQVASEAISMTNLAR